MVRREARRRRDAERASPPQRRTRCVRPCPAPGIAWCTVDRRAVWTASVREALAVVAITDDLRDGVDGLVARAMAAERGGATMLQVRFKALTSRELLRITRALVGVLQIPVVVNDRLDIALAADSAGVHVGVTDLPMRVARALAPEHFSDRRVAHQRRRTHRVR
jgi:hypothetical protein